MAASVLGKRSRCILAAEAESHIDLPSPKRQTRRTTVQIFEDTRLPSTRSLKPRTGKVQASQPTKFTGSRNTQSKHTVKTKTVTKASDNTHLSFSANSVANDCTQDENIPPALLATPTTNRVLDFLGTKTPSTPKHRVRLAGFPLTPRTPRSEVTRTRGPSTFTKARQLFTQSCNSSQLVGRDAERAQLKRFIARAIQKRSGGCTYVSGPPGTGKSALVQDVFREYEHVDGFTVSVINCVSLRTATDVFDKLLQDFAPSTAASKAGAKATLSEVFLRGSKANTKLVLLDEIDSLVDSEYDILYTLFEWALHQSSSVVLVGIANALDLTDRFLPRLKTRGLKPELLPVLPYTAAQISNIISTKLRSLLPESAIVDAGFVPFMHPAAIQLCGKKVASQTGDLRKAFSLVQRVLEQVEKEANEKHTNINRSPRPLSEIANEKSQQTMSPEASRVAAPTYCPETAPRASIAHVAKVASSIFNNGTITRLSGLNLQQKAVLCSLVSHEKRKVTRDPYATPSKSSKKIPSVKELFLKYSTLCKRNDGLLQPLKDTEFRDVVASLETLGLVHEQRGYGSSSLLTPSSTPSRSGRISDDKQVVSAVSEKEMRDSLTGAGADLLLRLLDEI